MADDAHRAAARRAAYSMNCSTVRRWVVCSVDATSAPRRGGARPRPREMPVIHFEPPATHTTTRMSLSVSISHTRRVSRRTARCRGFTLPEILIVIVMISVLALLALPRFADANARRHMESARLRMATALATARQAAVQRGVPVEFQLKSNRVTVRVAGTTADLSSPAPLDTLYKVNTVLPLSLSLSDGKITFSGRGYASLPLDRAVIKLSRPGTPDDSVVVTKFGMVEAR